jgi:hypothetical protein
MKTFLDWSAYEDAGMGDAYAIFRAMAATSRKASRFVSTVDAANRNRKA